MNFTPWTLLIDVGIVSALLLLGKLARARLAFIQRLFIPPSLLAGFCALILGPEVLGWLPLSTHTGTYAGILIALVFGSLPLTSTRRGGKGSDEIGRMWAYAQSGLLLQWALGGALGMGLLGLIWPLNDAFGLSMPSGFCGGHGTAAAIGEAFARYDVEEMLSLAMTAATVGIIAAVVIGLWLIKWGSAHGRTAFLNRFTQLPEELQTGILPKERRSSMGEASFSSISLDSMTFNFGVVALIALCGYGVSQLIARLFPALMLPVFSCAFIVGLLLRRAFDLTRTTQYLSPKVIGHLSGAFTDYLVAFGVASIKLTVVARYLVPLVLLLGIGLLCTLGYVLWVGRRIHRTCWFEKAVFTWGWFTGTMAMSIALLRIVDPETRSRCLDDYAYAYIYIAPVEIALVTFAPVAFAHGFGGGFLALCAGAGIGILLFAVLKGWLVRKPLQP